jgi:hypothetical protein
MRRLQVLVLTLVIMLLVVYLAKNQPQRPQKQQPPVAEKWPQQPPQPPPPARPKTLDEALGLIAEADLKDQLAKLCSTEWEGRMSGKHGNRAAAEWVKRQYEGYGLRCEFQKFPIQRVNPGPKNETGDDYTNNVIAWMDGSDPKLKDEIVVVGAHMDHIGYGPKMSSSPSRREIHPGADDNASGTVALLQISKACAALKGQNKRTIVFMSFSGEEIGLIGSRYYCNNPLFPKGSPNIKNHVFMLNMDMVGYLGKLKNVWGEKDEDSSPDVTDIIKKMQGKYPFARGITGRGGGGSDHASFYNKGVPVACLHTGMHSRYHTPDDKPEFIYHGGIEKVAKYAFEVTWAVSQADNKPAFWYGATFKPMSYDHDHGIIPFIEK